jgi:hypothetical protein
VDAFTANIDRSWRNPNLLLWHRDLWAIDHGAALVFQHAWPPVRSWAQRRYDLGEHVLLPVVQTLDGEQLAALDEELAGAVTPELLAEVLGLVPDGWLLGMNAALGDGRDAGAWRARYVEYLLARLEAPRTWRTGTVAA